MFRKCVYCKAEKIAYVYNLKADQCLECGNKQPSGGEKEKIIEDILNLPIFDLPMSITEGLDPNVLMDMIKEKTQTVRDYLENYEGLTGECRTTSALHIKLIEPLDGI